MTPQERRLVDDLFDRLAQLEGSPRDPGAAQAIAEGLSRAPNAVYALVQTVLVQDEALRRADQKIRELSGAEEPAPQSRGFLDSMRETVMGRTATSVPSVRASAPNEPDSRWNRGGTSTAGTYTGGNANEPYAPPPQGSPWQSGGGGSFLGTAAASAAGVVGGALLYNAISSMLGHRGTGSAFADTPRGGADAASPWDNSGSGGDLAREAGLNDIGRGTGSDAPPAGFFGDASDTDIADAGNDFGGGDFGGDGGGDSA